jgi:Beta-1,3-glucanase
LRAVQSGRDEHRNARHPARLAAAFNRGTLLTDSGQPDGENPADYYTSAITNHYARIVHATTIDGRGYAFPYDHVVSPAGADQSGAVVDPARRCSP